MRRSLPPAGLGRSPPVSADGAQGIVPAPFVQTRERIPAETAATCSPGREIARALPDHLLPSR